MHPLPPPSSVEFEANASVKLVANASVEFEANAPVEFEANVCCITNKTTKAPNGREVAMILVELDFHTVGDTIVVEQGDLE